MKQCDSLEGPHMLSLADVVASPLVIGHVFDLLMLFVNAERDPREKSVACRPSHWRFRKSQGVGVNDANPICSWTSVKKREDGGHF